MANVTYTLDADMAKAVDGFLKLVESQKKSERQFKKTTQSAKKQDKTLQDIHKSIIKMAGAVGGIYAIKRAFDATVGTGFKFNKILETSKLGIASIISANYDMVTADGRRLEGLAKINSAQEYAKDLQEDLRIAGLKTTATYEQLVFAFQTGLAPGSAVGLGLEQIQRLTVQITQAAGAIGMPMNQLAEEIRSLFMGTITPKNTRIATALGITPEDVRNWKEAGTLFEELTGKFGTFTDAGILAEQTWGGLSSNVIDALSQVLGEGFKPLFEYTKVEAKKLLDQLFKIKDDGTIELNKEMVELGIRGSEALMDIYLIGKDVAWVFGQIAGSVDMAYQTIGSWKHYKGAVGDLYMSLGNIADVAAGRKDWRTGGKVYQPGTRIPMPQRPGSATPQQKPAPPQSEADRLANIMTNQMFGAGYQRQAGVYSMTEKEYDEMFGGAAAKKFADKMQATMKEFTPKPDTIEAQYEETKTIINAQYDELLEQARTFSDSSTQIKQVEHDRAIALKNAEMETKKLINEREVENERVASNQRRQIRLMELGYLASFAGDASAMFGEMYARSGEQIKEYFLAQKMMAIAQTWISTHMASMMALGPPLGPVAGAPYAAAIEILGAAKVGLIIGQTIQGLKTEKPPGYAMGGVVYPTGDPYGVPIRVAEREAEAIVPAPGGAIPVKLSGGGRSVLIQKIYLSTGDVYDQKTMYRLVATVSEGVARAVAPGAVLEARRLNRGGMRDMMG